MSIDYDTGQVVVDDLLAHLERNNVKLKGLLWEPQFSGRSLFIKFDLESGLPAHEVRAKIVERMDKALRELEFDDWLVAFERNGKSLDQLVSGTPHSTWLILERMAGRIV